MPKKASKKSGDDNQPLSNQVKSETESSKKASKSEGSNAFFWIIFVLLSGGLCFGIKTYLDEELSKIAEQFVVYNDRIKSAVESQANTKQLAAAIHSVSEIKEALDVLQQKQDLASEEIQIFRNNLKKTETQQLKNVKELQLLNQDFKANFDAVKKLENQVGNELVQSFSHLNSSLFLAKISIASMEKEIEVFQSQFRDSDKQLSSGLKDIEELRKLFGGVNHEIKEVKKSFSTLADTMTSSSEDVKQLFLTTNSNNEKMSSLEASVSTLAASQSKLESRSKHNEDTINSYLVENKEKQATFERGLSDKMALLEQKSSKKFADMFKDVTDAKQLVENMEKDSAELQENLKQELTDNLKKLVDNYLQLQMKIHAAGDRIKKVEDQLPNLQSGDSKAQFDDVNAQVRRIAAEVDGVTQALSRLEDNLQQSELKTETRFSALTENVKQSKDELSNFRDDIADLYASLEDVENKMAGTSAQSENAKQNVKQETPSKN